MCPGEGCSGSRVSVLERRAGALWRPMQVGPRCQALALLASPTCISHNGLCGWYVGLMIPTMPAAFARQNRPVYASSYQALMEQRC